MANSDYAIPASQLLAAIREKGVNAVTTVPDLIQFALHDRLKTAPDITYVECAAENQALTMATGMYVGGMEPIVMMQNQGLFNCINTLRSVGIDAKIPLVLFVGAFGREFSNLGHPIENSRRVLTARVPAVVQALGVPFFHLETAADMPKVGEAFDTARAQRCAAVVHLGYFPSWT